MASLQILLQLATSLLLAAQANPSLPLPLLENAVQVASRAIQLSSHAIAEREVGQIPNESIWPNVAHLSRARYLDLTGERVPLGRSVGLLAEYTSFGDMNGDELDDAVVVVRRMSPAGTGWTTVALATMLNQGGILFNVGTYELGREFEIYSHRIESGQFSIEMKTGAKPRKMYRFKLLGNTLVEIQNNNL